MKNILILLLFALNFASQPTINEIAGTYENKTETKEGHLFSYTLKLDKDGSFNFHGFRKIKSVNSKEEHRYAKGKWSIEGKTIVFTSTEKDTNTKNALNLNQSKAVFKTKNPRDKSDKIVKTSVRFYESKTKWIKGLQLYKLD